MTNLIHDLRYALRQLRKSPGFAMTAVLTLALGIGAVTAIYSVADAVVLKPFPYNGIHRIVAVVTHTTHAFVMPGEDPRLASIQPDSWPEYLDMRHMNSTFRAFAGVVTGEGATMMHGSQAVYLHRTAGTDNFFDVFGVRPILGRTFLPGEDQPGKNDIAVLSYEAWQQYFGGDKSVIGLVVHLDGQPTTIIGVMPAGFRYPVGTPDLIYTPLHVAPFLLHARDSHWLRTLGRLKTGVTLTQAQADMSHVMDEIARQYATTDAGRTAQIMPLSDYIHASGSGNDERLQLWALMGAVFSVLVIVCVNIAGLQLARAATREREMAIRVAVGAARQRLMMQILMESAVLGVVAALAGTLLAQGLIAVMQQFLEHAFARGGNIQMNLWVLAASLATSLLASLLAGLIPAWRAARTDPNIALKSGTTGATSHQQYRTRATFVVVQLALSLVLMICSGLLLLGLNRMMRVSLGFNPKNLLTLQLNIPMGDYKGRDFYTALIQPLENKVQSIPGVQAVGFDNHLPILEYGSNSSLQIVGHPPDPPEHERFTEMRFVTPGFFAAMQLPILSGRGLNASDGPQSRLVTVVNETWVKEFLSSREDPLIQSFSNGDKAPAISIVGVAKDGRQNLAEPAKAEADFPLSQIPDDWRPFITGGYLLVRTQVPTTSIVPQLRAALHDVAPNMAFETPETYDDVLADVLVTNRMESWLFGIFAAIAVLLAAIGIYGLLSQEVASRTRDIGVRMALGATRQGIAQLMLSRIARLLAAGLAIGLATTFLLSRVLASALTIHPGSNGLVIAGITLMLIVVGLIAAYIPARRASRIDPMQVLRNE